MARAGLDLAMEDDLRGILTRRTRIKPQPHGHSAAAMLVDSTMGLSVDGMTGLGGPSAAPSETHQPMAISIAPALVSPLLAGPTSSATAPVAPRKDAPVLEGFSEEPRVRLISAVAPAESRSEVGGPMVRDSKRRRTLRSTAAARRSYAKDQSLFAAIEYAQTHVAFTVFDTHRNVVATHRIEQALIVARPGWAEQCPMTTIVDIQMCMKEGISKLTNLGRSIASIASIGLTTYDTTVVAWDRTTGKPLANAIVASDVRAQTVATDLAKSRDEVDVVLKTGQTFTPALPACKIKWLLDSHEDVRQAQSDGRLLCGTMDAWILSSLCGGEAACATDITTAVATGLADLRGSDWDNEMCDLVGIEAGALPHIRSNCELFGVLTDCAGPLKGLAITGCMSARQAAALGRGGCLATGTASVTLGSGDGASVSALLNVGCSYPSATSTDFTPVVCHQLGPTAPRFFGVLGEADTAAAGLPWLIEQMQMVTSVDEAERVALGVRDSGDVFFVPPSCDSRGSCMGLSPFSSRGHVVRAVLDSVCFQVDELLESCRRASGGDSKVRFVQADGPLARHRTLMQLQADTSGIPVTAHSPSGEIGASLGTALAAALGAGVLSHPERLHGCTAPGPATFTCQARTTAIHRAAQFHRWQDARRRTSGCGSATSH